jgi:hypothetical protein
LVSVRCGRCSARTVRPDTSRWFGGDVDPQPAIDEGHAGVVRYTGTSTLPFGDTLRAVPVSALGQVPPG